MRWFRYPTHNIGTYLGRGVERHATDTQSALQPLPNIFIPNVADMFKSGMKNLLAIAAATKINFKEAKTMKTALAKTETTQAKNERG